MSLLLIRIAVRKALETIFGVAQLPDVRMTTEEGSGFTVFQGSVPALGGLAFAGNVIGDEITVITPADDEPHTFSIRP